MLLLLRALLIFLFLSSAVQAKDWTIGIQSPFGSERAEDIWQKWVDSVNSRLSNDRLIIKRISVSDFPLEFRNKSIDFIIAQPIQILLTTEGANVSWIASLQSLSSVVPSIGDNVGSAIWVRADSPIHALSELKGKKVAAVAESAFGGYIGDLAVLVNYGIRESDLKINFTDYPVNKTFEHLLKNKAEAAITPLCLYEKLVDDGLIQSDSVRLLSPKHMYNSCQGNISLKSNWVLASLAHVPESLSKQLAVIALSDRKDLTVPIWIPPKSNTEAEMLLNRLGKHPNQLSLWENIQSSFNKNRHLWELGLMAVFVIIANHFFAIWLAQRRNKRIKAINQDLNETERLVYQADRVSMLGEMVSGIGHELNQPLSAILYFAEGLKLGVSSDKLKNDEILSALDSIVCEVKSSKKIIDNVRLWGKRPLEDAVQEVDLSTFLDEVKKLIFIRRNINISIVCPTSIAVRADPLKLTQIILNAVLNSFQAGATEISIVCDQESLKILDNGPGFSKEQLDFPFVPFRTTRKEGLGIGLVICERLAKSMGMYLNIANKTNEKGVISGALIQLIWRDAVA